jgi:tetratricopeptide (TPR) repeat protein
VQRFSRDRALYLATLLAAVLGAAAWFVSDVGANDLYWHLAFGREYFAQGQLPRSDTLSFTFAGRPWQNHEWLWGVLAYGLFRVDPEYLAYANWALLALAFGLGFETARSASESRAGAVLACWLAACCTSFFSDIRPHLVTLCFTMVVTASRNSRLAVWLWPVLIALWCNLHAGYLFGLGAVGLLVITRVAQDRRQLRVYAGGLALSCLAIAVNPWGFGLLEYVLSYAPGAQRSFYAEQLNEWQPLDFNLAELRFFGPLDWLGSFRGRYAALLLLAACGAARTFRRDPYLVMLGATTVLMALRAVRFVELSALVLAPLVAAGFAQLSAATLERVGSEWRARWGWLAPALLLLAAAGLWSGVRWLPKPFERWTQPNLGPRAAVRYLSALRVPLRVLNYEAWGGYISLYAPQAQIFIDGRANTVFDEQLYRDYLDIMLDRAPLAPLLAKYQPDAALLPHSRTVDQLRALPRPWLVAYEDPSAVLLLPPDSAVVGAGVPNPGEVLADEPQWLRRTAMFAGQNGDQARALALLQRALNIDPLFLPGYKTLMTMVAQRAGPAAAEELAEAAFAELPEQQRTLTRYLADIYEQHGDQTRAAALFREAIVSGPFDAQLELREHVLKLEAGKR